MAAQPDPPSDRKLLPRKARKRRRNSNATPIPPDMVARLLQLPGFTKSDVAHMLGISPSTLDERIERDEELKAAVVRGLTQRRFIAATALQKALTSGKVPAVIFAAKSILGMKEEAEAPQGGTNFLVETRPKAASMDAWQEEYGPLRAPKAEG